MTPVSRRSDRILLSLAGTFGAAWIAWLAWYMPLLVRGDYLRHVERFSAMLERDDHAALLAFIFEIQSGHILVPSKIVAILNYLLLDYSAVFSKVMALGLVAGGWAVFWICARRSLGAGGGTGVALLFGTVLLLNPTHYDIFVWTDAAHAIVPVGFLTLLTLRWAEVAMARTGSPWRRSAPVAALGLLTVLANGVGMMVLPALLLYWVLDTSESGPRKRLPVALTAGAGLIALAGLALASLSEPLVRAFHLDTSLASLAAAAETPGRCVAYFLSLMVAPWVQSLSLWSAALGGVHLAWYAALVALAGRPGMRAARLWLAYALAGLGAGLLIALFRFRYEIDVIRALSPRYAIYVLPFQLGLIVATVVAWRCGLPGALTGGPIWRRRAAVAAGLLVVGVTLAGFAGGLPRLHTKSLGIAREMGAAQQATANWTMLHAVRLTSAPGRLGPLYLETFPRFKRTGKVPLLSDRFIADGAAFVAGHGIALPARIRTPDARLSRHCQAEGDGRVDLIGEDTRFPFRQNPPHIPFVRFIGYARNPSDCAVPVDYVFAADGHGTVLCVSRTMGDLWWDLPRPLQDRYRNAIHVFDFSCPVPKGVTEGGLFTIYSFVAGTRLLHRLN